MKIGDIELERPLVLAPMAGVADLAFRIVCRGFGAQYAVSEMISAKALTYNDRKTFELLETNDDDSPLGIQIFGHEPDVMAKAAYMLTCRGVKLIDINMGCPTPKIVGNGDGAALMRDPILAAKIAKEVVKACEGVPVSVKFRSGWDEDSINAVDFAKRIEDAGASFITIHARPRSRFYAGRADWDIIAAVKRAVSVPVIGNGDVLCGADAVKMIEHTACDGVMIGRASLGAPWVFAEAAAAMGKAPAFEPLNIERRMDVAIKHARLAVRYKGEQTAVREMRKHLAWYFKGLRGAHIYKEAASRVNFLFEVEALCRDVADKAR